MNGDSLAVMGILLVFLFVCFFCIRLQSSPPPPCSRWSASPSPSPSTPFVDSCNEAVLEFLINTPLRSFCVAAQLINAMHSTNNSWA